MLGPQDPLVTEALSSNELCAWPCGCDAFAELQRIVSDIEAGLSGFRPHQKINYLMLMMVDRDVHFHVLPRYEATQDFEGTVYPDAGWPAVPDLAGGVRPDAAAQAALVAALKSAWPDGSK